MDRTCFDKLESFKWWSPLQKKPSCEWIGGEQKAAVTIERERVAQKADGPPVASLAARQVAPSIGGQAGLDV